VTEVFSLPLPRGYRSREIFDFYGRDSESVSERVGPDLLEKCMLIAGRPALVEIRFEGDAAICRTDAADLSAAQHAVVGMLGLNSGADEFEALFAADPLMGSVIQKQRGLRIPLTPEPWEALAWAIMGQQISVKVAVMLRRNLISAAGELHVGGFRAHPSAEAVTALDPAMLRELKFSRSKGEYILAAARAVASGELPIHETREMPLERAMSLAASIRGIGPWTIQYFFLRGLGLRDCLPAGDAGLAQGLARLSGTRPSEALTRKMMARYSPWRSLATYHVWASLKT
jgi:3-methyladenine DNA glycosylase/8-oxoguanine DNA glycosylase